MRLETGSLRLEIGVRKQILPPINKERSAYNEKNCYSRFDHGSSKRG
jgi:hypothetical protein